MKGERRMRGRPIWRSMTGGVGGRGRGGGEENELSSFGFGSLDWSGKHVA